MNFILLTHEREFSKKSGSGKLVKKVLGSKCQIVQWSRVEPDNYLENVIDVSKTALLYPKECNDDINIEDIENFILLDGTWQEAKKIYNKTPYLKKFTKLRIDETKQSIYNKRRNQIEGGLCTAESVISILNSIGEQNKAKQLENELLLFLEN